MAKKRISYKSKFEQSQAELERQKQETAALRQQLEVRDAEAKILKESMQKPASRSRSVTWLEIGIAAIGLLVAILVGIQVRQQTRHMGEQTAHMALQTEHMGHQTGHMGRQTQLIETQNRLFQIQDSLFAEQNRRIDTQIGLDSTQNIYVLNQNQLFAEQNRQIANQLRLDSTQNLLFLEQNNQILAQSDLMRDQTRSMKVQDTLIYNQNSLIKEQSEKIDVQIELLESDRRSSLVIMMGNIMDQVTLELKGKNKRKKRVLKQETISRIIALSHALKPYIYLENGKPIEKPLSPERGQLLLTLANLKLSEFTYNYLFQRGVFTKADLKAAPLINLYLAGIRLSGANLSYASLLRADLMEANLSGSNLEYTYLWEANLSFANLRQTNLSGAALEYADLSFADLRGANLFNANLKGANLYGTDLWKADLSYAYLWGVDFTNTQDYTAEQLKSAKTLYDCKNLPIDIEIYLRREKPCLFTPEGCN